jgi:hypothetical protein
MRKLYEIREDIQKAIDFMMYGDEAPATPLEDLDIEATEKIKNCFHVINHLEAEAAEADLIIKNAQDYKKKRLEAIDRIEADIKITMEVMGLKKIDEPDCRVTIQAGREKVEILDAGKIPVCFFRVIPETKEPDKVTMLKALKNGESIDGVKLTVGDPILKYPKIKGE